MRARITRALVALLLATVLLSPIAGAAAAVSPPGAQEQTVSLSEPAGDTVLYQQNGTTNQSSAAPSSAERARVTPVQFGEEWLSTSVVESDTQFNTSGPFAIFSITEPVEAVRIQQQGARAELLEGGQTVRVSYTADAAPDPDNPSLYKLEVFYADGSESTVELYARATEVSVDAASLEQYKPLLYDMRDDADDKGYSTDADGLEAYYEDTRERADLLDSLFVEKASQAVATVIAWFLNPVAIGITLLMVAILSYWRMERRGYVLDAIANDSGKAQRLRERLRLAYKENQQTADEERLQELPTIGSMSEVYWRDGQGVSTVYQLAEIARSGRVVKRNGELLRVHSGVRDLHAGDLDDSWLETVAGGGRQRIASYDIALSHLKTALERMMSTYGMAHLYQDTYEEVVELIDEHQEIVREGSISTGSSEYPSGGSGVGGD